LNIDALEDNFEFKIEGSLLGQDVSWEILPPHNNKIFSSISIQLGIEFSLTGNEFLIFKIKNPSRIYDKFENKMIQDEFKIPVKKFKYISQSDKEGAEGAGAVSLYAMLPSLAISVGLSLILYFFNANYICKNSNTPIEGMWIAISVLQMISYLALININFPENLLTFLSYVETVHNFNKWFPNPFTYIIGEAKMDMTPYTEQFERRGFTNRNMVFLCGSDLALMAITILVILVLIPISGTVPYFTNLIINKIKDLQKRYSKN